MSCCSEWVYKFGICDAVFNAFLILLSIICLLLLIVTLMFNILSCDWLVYKISF